MDIAHWDNTPEDKQTEIFLAIIAKHKERSQGGHPSAETQVNFDSNEHIEEKDVIEENREEVGKSDQSECNPTMNHGNSPLKQKEHSKEQNSSSVAVEKK